jgi:3-methyladenine DNA glycosylase AlkD
MTHRLVKEVRAALEEAADPVKARQMQAYMKSLMPYRGVSAPVQRALWRKIFGQYPVMPEEQWRAVALELWRQASYREERYAAVAFTDLKMYRPYRTMDAMPMFEEMIVTGAWWDFVDAIAGHHLGDVLRANPRRMKPLMRRWSTDEHMWKRRASILCQLGFKHDTDLDLLYACIEPNLADNHSTRETTNSLMARDFFIRKAIGWALRQYAWTDPVEVKGYVTSHRSRLSGLSIREAMKNI